MMTLTATEARKTFFELIKQTNQQHEVFEVQHKAGNAVIMSADDYESLQETPLYCKQDIFIFYIQWLIFLLIGNTMKNTMLRKGLTIF